MPRLECPNAEAAERYEAEVADRVWGAYVDAGAIREGHFNFASSSGGTVKIDGETLYREGNERQLGVVLGAVAGHPCIQEADVLTYVPQGQKKFAHLLGGLTGLDIADVERAPRATSRYDFVFPTDKDRERAVSAERPFICEDVVSTLGSVAGVRRLLLPEQNVHSVAQVLRGEVNPDYQDGLSDHYLTQVDMPLDMTAPEVFERFGFYPVSVRNSRVTQGEYLRSLGR